MTAAVSIRSVSQTYGSAKALDAVSLDIAAGEYIVLLGPSGCGKTTLLTLIGGFAEPSGGQILIGGRDMAGISPKDRPTTTVFQDYALFPHMTLADNVAFGLRMRHMPRPQRQDRAEQMLALVGLEGRGARRPHELSGGQRQRVALARALAVEPDVLLLDEPLGALDLKLRRQMQDELKAIQTKVGTTFIHVTHDQEEAMAIADRIVVMNAGRIEDAGPPAEVYLRPKTLFTASFMGEVNRIPLASGLSSLGAILPGTAPQDGTLMIRPEAIGAHSPATQSPATQGPGPRDAPPTGALPLGGARLLDIAFFGTYRRARFAPLAAPDLVLTAHLPQSSPLQPGAEVSLWAGSYIVLEGRP